MSDARLIAEVRREIALAARTGREHSTVGYEFRRAQEAGSVGGRWFVTPHAVQRWREHFDRRASSYEQALGRLIAETADAHFVKALDTGPQLWRGPRPRRARFVVSVCSEGELPSLVTVLAPFDGWGAKR